MCFSIRLFFRASLEEGEALMMLRAAIAVGNEMLIFSERARWALGLPAEGQKKGAA